MAALLPFSLARIAEKTFIRQGIKVKNRDTSFFPIKILLILWIAKIWIDIFVVKYPEIQGHNPQILMS